MEFNREQVKGSDKTLLVIDSVVYDVTSFAEFHPGGQQILLDLKGKDATEQFYGLHRQEVLEKYKKLRVGTIKGEQPKILKNEGISKVPYAEPSFWQGFHSAYYNGSHKQFRVKIRQWLHDTLDEEGHQFEEAGEPCSKENQMKLGSAGVLAMLIGPGPHLKPFNLVGGVKPEQFDYFHEMILHEELCNLGYYSYKDSFEAGLVIGLPPVLHFATKDIKDNVVPLILAGKKRICLAITEPGAGSDVANVQTNAVLSPDGKHYIVNGVKKWITGGYDADYFTTAVKTPNGFSVLLIERTEGVDTKRIKTVYAPSAGTSLVVFENVKVPVGNLIGKEGQGFQIIMHNFNHERWYICSMAISAARLITQESFKWANQRKVFGKKLLEQAVIRFKLANMISQIEGLQNWIENLTHQMNTMPPKEQALKLGGPTALLKYRCTRAVWDIVDDACQIFGGRAITKTGMGRLVEQLYRIKKGLSIPGGSEEIMADLAIRQAMVFMFTSEAVSKRKTLRRLNQIVSWIVNDVLQRSKWCDILSIHDSCQECRRVTRQQQDTLLVLLDWKVVCPSSEIPKHNLWHLSSDLFVSVLECIKVCVVACLIELHV
ncbi:acyl-CoA dehydrogenase/oxidase [Gorgonomyces haynaldii]|nr:acyl-CoA dehydrogenase/oxidase [Gorgonomyces haynaldii]